METRILRPLAPCLPRMTSDGDRLGAPGVLRTTSSSLQPSQVILLRAMPRGKKRGSASRAGAPSASPLPSPFEQERVKLLPRQPALAARKVRPTTQELYLGVIKLLLGWLSLTVLPAWPRERWDSVLGEFIDWMFDQGFSQSSANRVGPAIMWADPLLHTGAVRTLLPT